MRQEQISMTKTECFRQTRSTSCHGRTVMLLCLCFGTKEIAGWLTTGKTVFVMKDRGKGNDVTNFKPITCLSPTWKIYSLEFLVMNYMTIWKVRDCVQRNKRGAEKNQGDKIQIIKC